MPSEIKPPLINLFLLTAPLPLLQPSVLPSEISYRILSSYFHAPLLSQIYSQFPHYHSLYSNLEMSRENAGA